MANRIRVDNCNGESEFVYTFHFSFPRVGGGVCSGDSRLDHLHLHPVTVSRRGAPPERVTRGTHLSDRMNGTKQTVTPPVGKLRPRDGYLRKNGDI